jgi:hypothetical protein
MTTVPVCRFCGDGVAIEHILSRAGVVYHCPTCGDYFLDPGAEFLLTTLPIDLETLARVSQHIADWHNCSDDFAFSITQKDVENGFPFLPPLKSVTQRIAGVLIRIGDRSKGLGAEVSLNPKRDWAGFGTMNHRELVEVLDHLEADGAISTGMGEEPGQPMACLTAQGWRRYEELVGHRAKSRKSFLAYSFSPDLEGFRSAATAAMKGCGYEVVDMNGLIHDQKICDRIIAEIRTCGLLIADVTNERPNVYYEAGFAASRGVPVIWTARKGTTLHFDTRQYPHVFWDDEADLQGQLDARVRALYPLAV